MGKGAFPNFSNGWYLTVHRMNPFLLLSMGNGISKKKGVLEQGCVAPGLALHPAPQQHPQTSQQVPTPSVR